MYPAEKQKGHAQACPFHVNLAVTLVTACRPGGRGLRCGRPRDGRFMSRRGRRSWDRLLHHRRAGTQG